MPHKWSSYTSHKLLLHSFPRFTAYHSCLESKITGAGVSLNLLLSACCGVMRSQCMADLACGLKMSWRLSRMATSLGSHHNSLPKFATAWMQAAYIACSLSGITTYILVRVQSLATAGLTFFADCLWCFLNIRCASIQLPSKRVTSLLSHISPFPSFSLLTGLAAADYSGLVST